MSGQNWAAMLTGSGSKVHGDSNQCIRGNKLPTIFDALGQSLKTALVHEWTPIVVILNNPLLISIIYQGTMLLPKKPYLF